MSDILTPDDLAALSRVKRKAAQIAWLRAKRIRFVLGADGRPVTRWSWIDRTEDAPPQRVAPNLRAIPGGA